jgi:hypothetical protein
LIDVGSKWNNRNEKRKPMEEIAEKLSIRLPTLLQCIMGSLKVSESDISNNYPAAGWQHAVVSASA